MKLHVPIPRWFLVLAVAGLVLAGALAVVAPFAVYMGAVLGWYASLFVLFVLWSRVHVRPLLEQARQRGERRPYVELQFPRWVRTAAASWIVLFSVSTVILVILLVVAALELRLR